MPTGIEKLAPQWDEPKEEGGIRLKFIPLTGLDALELMPELSFDDEGNMVITGKGLRLAVTKGVVDWEGDAVHDEAGNKYPVMSVNINRLIPPNRLRIAAQKIINATNFTGEDEKN